MNCHLLMDCAYEGNETRQLALDLGFIPVVPPNPQRLQPWKIKQAWYRRRNEVERLFRRLKGAGDAGENVVRTGLGHVDYRRPAPYSPPTRSGRYRSAGRAVPT